MEKITGLRGLLLPSAAAFILAVVMPVHGNALAAPIPASKPPMAEQAIQETAQADAVQADEPEEEGGVLGIKFSAPEIPNDDGGFEGAQNVSLDTQPAKEAPRLKPLLGSHAKSAQGLSENDIARYRDIFALQKEGKMEEADNVISDLDDHRLMGHVLHQRYMHPTGYTSKFSELKEWLEQYADHPGAREIYKLAGHKGGGKASNLPKPRDDIAFRNIEEPTVVYGKNYRGRVTNDGRSLQKEIDSLLRHDRPTQSRKMLESDKRAKSLDKVQQDQLRGKIAARYFYGGHYKKAYDVASEAVARSQFYVPRAAWIAGLTSWQKGGYKSAAQFFGMAAKSPYASGWMQAAGSYWAARSYMRLGQVEKVSQWLEFAQEHPRTFYGLLATRALGRDFDFNWSMPLFTQDSYRLLNGTKEGYRAIALVAVGQTIRAEKELMRLSPNGNDELRRAMLAFADYAELPGLAMQLGSRMNADDGSLYDAALYPVGPWLGSGEYKVDPALMYAVMRQESRFDAAAESYQGARGLMQIMPATASYMANNPFYKSKAGRHALLDPKTNIALGQNYIVRLLSGGDINGDLVSMLVAYNAGPGNLRKWRREMDFGDDPLMFIESIPAAETRSYVERVLSNYWIYRMRAAHYRQERDVTLSIETLAQGQWPDYFEDQSEEMRLAAKN